MSNIENFNSLPPNFTFGTPNVKANIDANVSNFMMNSAKNRFTDVDIIASNTKRQAEQFANQTYKYPISNIFTVFNNPIGENEKNIISRNFYNRANLPDIKTAEEFNTYLHFGIFPAFADTTPADYDEKNGYKRKEESLAAGTAGVRSLFNRAGAVLVGVNGGEDGFKFKDIDITKAHEWRLGLNVPLMDSPQNRRIIKQETGCSVKELVSASQKGLMGKETYAYSDFMFCKHLGTVSNNYMVTLRRFPIPVDDYIGTTGIDEDKRRDAYFNSKNPVSIGCMVTWIGVSGNDMSNILKYSYSMPFKEQEAEMQDKKLSADKSESLLNGMFSMFDSQYRKEYMNGHSGVAANVIFSKFGLPVGPPPYTGENAPGGFKDRNKVYGPVDAVKSTYIRSEQGLKFDQQISLVFEYELRSYNGVNGRQAMLDLISNILNVTYTTGSFWGGGIRGFGASQSNIFNNLNIFKCKGGFTDFIDAFSEDISGLTKRRAANDKNMKDYDFENGKSLIKNALKTLNQLGGMLMAGMLNKLGRPQKVMYNSLLSPAPIGFWHLTIGNPRKPIMSIGNMVITGCTIEHQGPLGLDDFPTGLKVTVNLSRGKPRDIRDIEKLYMAGNDRIYSPMDTKVFDMYKNAIDYQKYRKSNDLNSYDPKSRVHIIDWEQRGNYKVELNAKDEKDGKSVKLGIDVDGDKVPELNHEQVTELNDVLMKYFGTNDIRAIYTAATEQEWGSNIKRIDGVISEDEYQKALNKQYAKMLSEREKKIYDAKIEYLKLKTEFNNASKEFSQLGGSAYAIYEVNTSNTIKKLNAAAEKEVEAYDALINFMNENKEYLKVPVSDDRKNETVLSNIKTQNNLTMGNADLSRGYDIMYNHFSESVSAAKEYQNKAPELLQKALNMEQTAAKYMDDLLNGRLPSQNNIPVIRQGR